MSVLYSSSLSPFCSVLQVFLDYEGISGYKRVEVDPWKKTILQSVAGSSGAVLPFMVFDGGRSVAKAQEIIDHVQRERGAGKAGLFTNAMKNQCMRINERVLPLVALNRHLTWSSTHETVQFIQPEHEGLWGWWHSLMAKKLVPVLYLRIWRKMGFRVLKDTGYAECSPEEALVRELEAWQKDGGKIEGELFGGSKPNVVDLWMYGQLKVFKRETLFRTVEAKCPHTMVWMKNIEKFV